MSDDDSTIGKIEEKIGWLTADRKVEAKGKLRRLDADAEDGNDADADAEEGDGEVGARHATLDDAEQELRQDYGEHDPAVEADEE